MFEVLKEGPHASVGFVTAALKAAVQIRVMIPRVVVSGIHQDLNEAHPSFNEAARHETAAPVGGGLGLIETIKFLG